MVARRGVDLTKYGLVPSRAAKMQRLGGSAGVDGGVRCPLELHMVEEYEAFQKRFRTDVHSHEGACRSCKGKGAPGRSCGDGPAQVMGPTGVLLRGGMELAP